MRAAGRVTLVAVSVVSAFGCEDTVEERFEEQVVPVLEARCSAAACHGSPEAAQQRVDPKHWLTFRIDAKGRIADHAAALDSVKGKVNSTEGVELSTFLRKTLPVAQGGQYHFQSSVFQSREDADYKVLRDFAAMLKDGREGRDAPLTANEKLFADEVYPELIARGCATSTCHGSLMFGGAIFESPAVPGSKLISRHALRATYTEAKRNLTFWGNPRDSRLLAKIVPLEKGGIPHKGGNDVFFARELEAGKDPYDSAFVKSILKWLEAERKAEFGGTAPAVPDKPSLVVVGGPVRRGGPFDVPAFTPGTDLYRLEAPYTGEPVNLTASAHAAPADIRDPAISHDGRTIAFSMRKSEEDAHNIYTINVDGTGLRQLTNDRSRAANGRVVGNFSPTFGPNGGFVAPDGKKPASRLYFSSTRAADPSDLAAYQNADLYVMDPDGANLERLTYTVVPEVAPAFLAVGEFRGTMAYTIKRSAESGYKGVFFRFPVDHNRDHHIQPEAHPHFGMSEPPRVFYGLRELANGRAVLTLLDEKNRWRGGQLALLERQFAVEVPEGEEESATLPGFRHALTVLTPDAAREGASTDGFWADPTPLPDGSLVVAHAPGPIDLADADASVRTELVRVYLEEDRASERPKVKRTEPLLSDPAKSWSQPVAVYARTAEDEVHERRWDHTSPTATLVHSGVQVIEAVLAQLPPLAPRAIREDLAYVRAMAPLSVAADIIPVPVPPEETRHAMKGATQLSLTGRMPLFAALEVPPAEDGSLAALIPPKVSVRVVTLDSDRMAVGALQHQWYATLPGEQFPVGIPLHSYNARCGGCHGAMDGKKESVLSPPVDVITQASVTAAMYENSDRRLPKALPTIDGSFFVFSDFQKDVQPILTAKCASCHSGEAAAGGLTLTATKTQHYTDAYESLLAPGEGSTNGFRYVDAKSARGRGSYLAERILGREYEAPRTLEGTCPPAGSEPLTADEKTAIVRWIEYGATYVGIPPAN